jgi:hypothetical protein
MTHARADPEDDSCFAQPGEEDRRARYDRGRRRMGRDLGGLGPLPITAEID